MRGLSEFLGNSANLERSLFVGSCNEVILGSSVKFLLYEELVLWRFSSATNQLCTVGGAKFYPLSVNYSRPTSNRLGAAKSFPRRLVIGQRMLPWLVGAAKSVPRNGHVFTTLSFILGNNAISTTYSFSNIIGMIMRYQERSIYRSTLLHGVFR